MASLDPLGHLRRLDRSAADFRDQLTNVLRRNDHKQLASTLGEKDLEWLVEYLDKALDLLDPAIPEFRKCLCELRHICGTRTILPTSYIHSSSLVDVGRQPFASGGFGDFYEATLGGSKVCVKRIRVYAKDSPGKAIQTLCQEAVARKHLGHKNIVPLVGVICIPPQLILEWMSGGILTEYIKTHPNADRLGLLSDVAEGLHFLHSRSIVHGDLKGSNIRVDAAGHARITDFNQITVIQDLDHTRSASDDVENPMLLMDRGHTGRWTAPEILSAEGTYSKGADVFSFAMVMVEVFTGTIPFDNNRPAAAMMAIMNGKRLPRPTHPALTDQLWKLIQRCWDQDPRLRPEVSEVSQTLLAPVHPAWKQLISNTLPTNERISLIVSIFSDHDTAKTVGYLSGNDAQSFIDAIYTYPVSLVLKSLSPKARKRCLRTLYRICGRQALLPQSLQIPLCHNPTDVPLCGGGFGDVWKGRYRDQEIIAKVLRVYETSDWEQIRKSFCREVATWKALCHPNVLPLLGVTMTETLFVMVSEWMANGNINEFLKADKKADRLGLLVEVTKGLIYMHELGIVHGDLKGANILIDNNGHACLVDFGLATIAADQSTVISSCMNGGTIEWMSPELLDRESFGLENSRPTKESDCYALGMVIYEILSGLTPFAPSGPAVVIKKVMEGERPRRPQGKEGTLFTDGIWKVVEQCWQAQPGDRTSAKVVLLGLEGDPSALRLTPGTKEDEGTDTDDQSDTAASNSGLLANPREGAIADR